MAKPTTEANQFRALAPVYDEVMRHVPYRMWVRYIHELLHSVDAAPATILDVACGTGSVAMPLAKAGYEVVGVDISAEMIEEAEAKARSAGLDIEYYAQDAAKMHLDRKFDLALSLFDSLNYIADPDSLAETFKRIAEHLNPGGVLIFDLNTEYAFTEYLFDQDNVGTDENPIYTWKSKYDKKAKICTVTMEFEYRDEDGPRTFTETHVQRAYSDKEIRKMLGDAGFIAIQVYHGYSRLPPGPNTDRVFYVARTVA